MNLEFWFKKVENLFITKGYKQGEQFWVNQVNLLYEKGIELNDAIELVKIIKRKIA